MRKLVSCSTVRHRATIAKFYSSTALHHIETHLYWSKPRKCKKVVDRIHPNLSKHERVNFLRFNLRPYPRQPSSLWKLNVLVGATANSVGNSARVRWRAISLLETENNHLDDRMGEMEGNRENAKRADQEIAQPHAWIKLQRAKISTGCCYSMSFCSLMFLACLTSKRSRLSASMTP